MIVHECLGEAILKFSMLSIVEASGGWHAMSVGFDCLHFLA